MRSLAVFLSALLTLSVPSPASTQTSVTQTSPAQALSLLQQSLAALVGNTTLSDITLTGSVRRIAGSDDETGTGVLAALVAGASRVDLSFPSGTRSELTNFLAADAFGFRAGPDGVSHAIALHNLLTGPSWFFPAFHLSRVSGSSDYVFSYVGPEVHNGQAVQHVSVWQKASALSDPPDVSFAHLTQVDFFLDPTSLFPVAISFNTHPEENALVDVPIEVRFSNYRVVNGVQIPFQIQKFLNNGLVLDFEVQTATPNSGLSSATFANL